MKKKIIIAIMAVLFVSSFIPFGASNCLAGAYNNYGLDETVSAGGDKLKGALSVSEMSGRTATSFLSYRVGSIVGTVLSFVGVIFLILIIFAGLKWMTSRGNQQEVEKAKDLIIAAVIGLIIVLAAYAITAFIGSTLVK